MGVLSERPERRARTRRFPAAERIQSCALLPSGRVRVLQEPERDAAIRVEVLPGFLRLAGAANLCRRRGAEGFLMAGVGHARPGHGFLLQKTRRNGPVVRNRPLHHLSLCGRLHPGRLARGREVVRRGRRGRSGAPACRDAALSGERALPDRGCADVVLDVAGAALLDAYFLRRRPALVRSERNRAGIGRGYALPGSGGRLPRRRRALDETRLRRQSRNSAPLLRIERPVARRRDLDRGVPGLQSVHPCEAGSIRAGILRRVARKPRRLVAVRAWSARFPP